MLALLIFSQRRSVLTQFAASGCAFSLRLAFSAFTHGRSAFNQVFVPDVQRPDQRRFQD